MFRVYPWRGFGANAPGLRPLGGSMAGMVVHGAQWGDEGKGKIVDLLTEKVSLIVRFHGGNNAGHTLVVGGEKTVLHLIPSGILHQGKRCVIGAGVVLDPEVFLMEADKLAAKGVDMSPARLAVSYRTHVIMPYHKLLDVARETAKAGGKIGTTGRGIGPCYEDKASRVGIRAGRLPGRGVAGRQGQARPGREKRPAGRTLRP